MSMYDSEAFWHDFMRRPDAQKALKLEQKMLIKEHAKELSSEYDRESDDLKAALLECSEEVKRLVSPIVKYQMVHRILYNLLKDCRANGQDFNEELLRPDSTIGGQLKALHQEWKSDPENVKGIQDKWSEICLEAKEEINQESYKKKEHTWKDIPKDELAERLSKGEIMPREEWIPGVSKGKRKLDCNSLKQHLTLGEQMRRDGRDSFSKGDYEMALTRFTQGVQLLNWVEGSNDSDNQMLEDMYVTHLRNQAQAAIKCEKYHEALKACNTIIQDIDEHDCKARYRRGKAYLLLGMIKYAKDDYLFILKSPYADRDSVKAAKAAINELKAIVNKYKTSARDIVEKSVAEDTFSAGRADVSEVRTAGGEGFEMQSDRGSEELPRRRLAERRKWFEDPPVRMDSKREGEGGAGKSGGKEEEDDGEERERWEVLRPAEPLLSAEKTKEILEELLELYTTDSVQEKLNECRRLGDFEERRSLLRIRKYLPEVQKPVLHRYGLANAENGYDYFEAKKALERTVGHWRHRDPDVKEMAKECWDAVFGDIADLDF